MAETQSLNQSQARRLLTHIQYADKLLSQIEEILTASNSKSPFRKYHIDISPSQSKVVQDYIARIRAHMLRVLEAQGIEPPGPEFGAIHSIRVTLAFVRIALTEIGPKYMRGYGEVPQSAAVQLNGLVTELEGMVDKLNAFLAQGLGPDLQARIERLQQTTDEVALLGKMERIVSEHGLVEFRPVLAMILDRLETRRFEIAVFGRVSSGKSSLLNHVLHAEVLPVGVNPVTSVPTRLVAGPEPKLTVSFVDRRREHYRIGQLAEFVTEQHNPANVKGVTEITVELPSPGLREGIVFVDTPGLGSLATSGAAETKAYLPRCDLGVVLINAGSTIAEDDIATLRALYEAGIPASILLSKADLLSPEDRASACAYIAQQIRRELGLNLTVQPVSIITHHAALLDTWFEREIAPLYERHQELVSQSVRRKVGALREAIEAALRSKLNRAQLPPSEVERLKELELDLRKAAGGIPEVLSRGLEVSDRVRGLAAVGLANAARELIKNWERKGLAGSSEIIAAAITRTVAAEADRVFADLSDLARRLSSALHRASAVLDVNGLPGEAQFAAALREMPRVDLDGVAVELRKPLLLYVSAGLAKFAVERSLRNQIGGLVSAACASYGRLLEGWIRKSVAEIQRSFDAYADGYRARLARLLAGSGTMPETQGAIARDLAELSESGPVEVR